MLTLLHRSYARLHSTVRELLEFGVVGATAFVVDVAVYNLASLVLGLGPLTSKSVSVLLATTVAYLGNRYWTFRHRARTGLRREYVLFLALNGVGLLIALVCLGVTFYGLGLTSAFAQNVSANVVGLGLGTAFRFWSYRRFVFPERVDTLVESPASTSTTDVRDPVVARSRHDDGRPLRATLRAASRSSDDSPGPMTAM